MLKVEMGYDKSCFEMTKKLASDIVAKQTFGKEDVIVRTEELKKYCVNRWWADVPEGLPDDVISDETVTEEI